MPSILIESEVYGRKEKLEVSSRESLVWVRKGEKAHDMLYNLNDPTTNIKVFKSVDEAKQFVETNILLFPNNAHIFIVDVLDIRHVYNEPKCEQVLWKQGLTPVGGETPN